MLKRARLEEEDAAGQTSAANGTPTRAARPAHPVRTESTAPVVLGTPSDELDAGVGRLGAPGAHVPTGAVHASTGGVPTDDDDLDRQFFEQEAAHHAAALAEAYDASLEEAPLPTAAPRIPHAKARRLVVGVFAAAALLGTGAFARWRVTRAEHETAPPSAQRYAAAALPPPPGDEPPPIHTITVEVPSTDLADDDPEVDLPSGVLLQKATEAIVRNDTKRAAALAKRATAKGAGGRAYYILGAAYQQMGAPGAAKSAYLACAASKIAESAECASIAGSL